MLFCVNGRRPRLRRSRKVKINNKRKGSFFHFAIFRWEKFSTAKDETDFSISGCCATAAARWRLFSFVFVVQHFKLDQQYYYELKIFGRNFVVAGALQRAERAASALADFFRISCLLNFGVTLFGLRSTVCSQLHRRSSHDATSLKAKNPLRLKEMARWGRIAKTHRCAFCSSARTVIQNRAQHKFSN